MNYKNDSTGAIISESDYERLPYSSKQRYRSTYSDVTHTNRHEPDGLLDVALGFGLGVAMDSLLSNNDSSSSDHSSNDNSSDFGGFGGGDSGGGGASGEW